MNTNWLMTSSNSVVSAPAVSFVQPTEYLTKASEHVSNQRPFKVQPFVRHFGQTKTKCL